MKQLTVREAREQRRPPLTQDELAAKSGVDQTYISLIERLLRVPSDDIKKRLAKALRIRPARLRFSVPKPESIGTHEADRAGHEASS